MLSVYFDLTGARLVWRDGDLFTCPLDRMMRNSLSCWMVRCFTAGQMASFIYLLLSCFKHINSPMKRNKMTGGPVIPCVAV